MSKCPSTSKRKRKLQTTDQSDCKKPVKKKMAWDSFTSIKDFGYKFNEEGRLVNIDSGDGFNFYVCEDDHWYNQQHYEMLGEVITEYVYELLQSEDVGLKKIEIPCKEKKCSSKKQDKKNKDSPKGFIFASEDFDKKDKLLILVHGSGVVRAGQWARRLIINDCLDHGTQIPYIKKAIEEGYGVVVTNTNQNEAAVEVNGKKKYKTIKESESPERHYSYVWKNIIEKTEASKMFLVGHSYGGYLIVDYFSRFPKILDRVVAVAFTDSVHSFHSYSKAQAKDWFKKNSVNWVTSTLELGTPIQYGYYENVTRVSAGTTKHEETSWKAMVSVFQFFKNHELELESPNEENNEGSGKSGGRQNRGVAANFSNKNEIVKHHNKGSVPSDLFCWSKDKSVSSCEQAAVSEGKETSSDPKSGKNHEKDGMNNYAEATQEKSENSENVSEEQDHETSKKEEKSNDRPEDGPDLELSTETQEPTTETQEPTTETKEPTTETQEPTTETQEPTTTETQEPIIETQKPTIETQEPTTETQEPTTETQEPTTETQEPTTETQEPTTTETQEPTTETQEPTIETQEPTTETQEPTTETQEPTTETQEPTTETQEPTTETQEPTTETQEPTTETASDVVQPTGRDGRIDTTFIGSTPSGASQTPTSDEITNTTNQEDGSLENNDVTNNDSAEQTETNAEDEKRTAGDPGDTSNSEGVRKVVVKAWEAKDIKRNDASFDTDKHEENVGPNLVEEKSDETSNLEPLGNIPVVITNVKSIAGTASSVNKKETPPSNTGGAIIEHTEDSEREEIKGKTNKDELSDGVQSSNTERPNSNNVHEPVNSEDAPSTALSDKHGENNEINITDKKSDVTNSLESTRSVEEEKDMKENGASSGIITDKHEENVEMKSEDLHTNEELPIGNSKKENVVDEKLKDDSPATNGDTQVKTTDDSSSKSEKETSV